MRAVTIYQVQQDNICFDPENQRITLEFYTDDWAACLDFFSILFEYDNMYQPTQIICKFLPNFVIEVAEYQLFYDTFLDPFLLRHQLTDLVFAPESQQFPVSLHKILAHLPLFRLHDFD